MHGTTCTFQEPGTVEFRRPVLPAFSRRCSYTLVGLRCRIFQSAVYATLHSSCRANRARGLEADAERSVEARKELAEASRLAPDTQRFTHVHAVALNDAGQEQQAIRALEAALARHPNQRELLLGLVLFLRDAGEDKRAATYARRQAEL